MLSGFFSNQSSSCREMPVIQQLFLRSCSTGGFNQLKTRLLNKGYELISLYMGNPIGLNPIQS